MGNGQIQPLQEKTEKLKTTPTSKMKKQVWVFLGLVSYYCHLIPHFSPLTDPTKTQPKQQIRLCEEIFQKIRDILWWPRDFSLPFTLQTNASSGPRNCITTKCPRNGAENSKSERQKTPP